MSQKRPFRITSDGTRFGTEVTDPEGGSLIHGVYRVSFTFDANAEEFATATIEILAEIDVTVEGEVKRLRLDAETGNYQEIE